ncbi:MAG: preprotein translocase subunit SecE [Ilumatobacteraceae bacterium]|jgi:preprotein translocase subunit SecE
MTMDLNREQKRTLKRMGALDEQGNPTRQAPGRRARDERTGPTQYVREVREEMNKVAWPKWPEIRRYSIVVLVTVAIFTALIGVADTGFGFLTDWLYRN